MKRLRCACGRLRLCAPRLLAVGSSTGGPQALFTLVQGLGKTLNVPVVLTQHMPATFTPILAEHSPSWAACPALRRRRARCWLPAGSIWRPAIVTC